MAAHLARISFTKDQLIQLLNLFSEELKKPSFEEQLASLAPNEDKMDELINTSQTAIIRQFLPGIPPAAVFSDIGRASAYFQGDPEVIAALANISLVEEKALNRAMKTETADEHLIQINPEVMKQVQEQIQQNPVAFKQQQEMLKQMYLNPDAAEKLKETLTKLKETDQHAYETFTQTLAAAAFFTPEPEKHDHSQDAHHHHAGPSTQKNQDDDDMPPLEDMDDDLEDNMN